MHSIHIILTKSLHPKEIQKPLHWIARNFDKKICFLSLVLEFISIAMPIYGRSHSILTKYIEYIYQNFMCACVCAQSKSRSNERSHIIDVSKNNNEWYSYITSSIYVGYWTFKPVSSTYDPRSNCEKKKATNCDRSIVKSLRCDGVGHRQWEKYWNCYHPKNCNPANKDSIAAQIERSWNKWLTGQGHPKEDGEGISNVESNSCNWYHGLKCHKASQWLQKILNKWAPNLAAEGREEAWVQGKRQNQHDLELTKCMRHWESLWFEKKK